MRACVCVCVCEREREREIKGKKFGIVPNCRNKNEVMSFEMSSFFSVNLRGGLKLRVCKVMENVDRAEDCNFIFF